MQALYHFDSMTVTGVIP